MLIAIDTSAGASVGLVDDAGTPLAERTEPDTRRHAEVIGRLLEGVLTDAGVAVTDLDGVAVGMGPGPFTGLRVGIAAARAFALGAGLPVLPVISHDAIALGTDGPLLVVTDARRRELYWSAYAGSDGEGLPVRLAEPGLDAEDDLSRAVPAFGTLRRVDAAGAAATSVGQLARLMLLHDRDFAGEAALYLRSPDVTLSAGPKRVTS